MLLTFRVVEVAGSRTQHGIHWNWCSCHSFASLTKRGCKSTFIKIRAKFYTIYSKCMKTFCMFRLLNSNLNFYMVFHKSVLHLKSAKQVVLQQGDCRAVVLYWGFQNEWSW